MRPALFITCFNDMMAAFITLRRARCSPLFQGI